MTQKEIYDRIARLKAQYQATRYALALALSRPDMASLHAAFTPRDLRDALRDLEALYTVRLVSIFEAALVSFARASRLNLRAGRRTMYDLMRRVAARAKLPADVLDCADSVRRSRNRVVHEGLPPTLSFDESKSFLNRYVSHLPAAW